MLQNRLRARCDTCHRRLKEKIEMRGRINRDDACSFRWNLRLQCIYEKDPSMISVLENGMVKYDRNIHRASYELIQLLRQQEVPWNYAPHPIPPAVDFWSVQDTAEPFDMNALILGLIISYCCYFNKH